MAEKKEKTTICVILDKELRDAVEAIAEKEERNLSYIVRKALQEYVDKN